MSEKIIFWAAFFVAYTLNAITGFAGNIIAMPVGMQTLGIQESIASLNVAGFLACGLLAIQGFKYIDWRQLARILAVMIVFMIVGIWLDTIVSLDILKKIFAIFVLIVGLKNLIFPQRKGVPEWLLWVALALAGILQGMFVCGGAMLVIYATQKLPEKDQFRRNAQHELVHPERAVFAVFLACRIHDGRCRRGYSGMHSAYDCGNLGGRIHQQAHESGSVLEIHVRYVDRNRCHHALRLITIAYRRNSFCSFRLPCPNSASMKSDAR